MSSHNPIAVLILLLVSCSALFIRLGSDSLRSWDEAVYAECAKEMVQDGDWLTIHWNGEKFFQKPPLFIWCTAFLYKLLGISEFTSRFVAALCGLGTVILTFVLARLFFPVLPALIAALMLLSSPAFFIFARSGMTDSMLTFFILLALYAYLKSSDARYWYVVATALGLATMTKGAAALPAVLVITAGALFSKPRSREMLVSSILFIFIGFSWHALMVFMYGKQFLNEYIGIQVFSRSVNTVDTLNRTPFFYVPMLGLCVILLPLGLWRVWRKRDVNPTVVVLAMAILALYAVVKTKHAWYILPALPMVSTIIAPGEGSRIRVKSYWILIVLNVVLLGFVLSRSRVDTPSHNDLAELAIQASRDSGPLGVYPDIYLGPEVLFYSNRRLCSEGDHTMASMTRCSPRHVITTQSDLGSLVTRYSFTVLGETGQFVYVRID